MFLAVGHSTWSFESTEKINVLARFETGTSQANTKSTESGNRVRKTMISIRTVE